MTTPNIRDIIRKVAFCQLCGEQAKEDIDSALLAIRKSILERLPSSKQGIKHHDREQPYTPTDLQKVGYNQCLEEVKKIIGEME